MTKIARRPFRYRRLSYFTAFKANSRNNNGR